MSFRLYCGGENLPVLIIWVTVTKETGDSLSHILVGEDIPQAIGCQYQHVVCSMFKLGEGIHLHL